MAITTIAAASKLAWGRYVLFRRYELDWSQPDRRV